MQLEATAEECLFRFGRSDDDFRFNLAVLRERGVIVYGAGKIGKHILATCRMFDVPVVDVWDLHADIIGSVHGYPVREPRFDQHDQQVRDKAVVIVTIFSENGAKERRTIIRENGYRNVCIDRSVINNLCFHYCSTEISRGQFKFDLKTCHTCPVQKDEAAGCSIFDRHISGGQIPVRNPIKGSPLVIRSMGVLISNQCNMTCVGCNHLRDHYRKSDNVDLEIQTVLSDLTRVAEAADFIKTVVLVGGEALLHPHVDRVIEGILAMPRIGMLLVITNGTVVPRSERVFSLLQNPRIVVEISGYGDNVPKHLRLKRVAFLEKLTALGINHRYVETLMWTDFGGFESRGYEEEQIREIYKSCCFVSNDMFNGRLFKCSRSAYGTHIGKIPDYPTDYVNIRDGSHEKLRQNLIRFFADEKPRACNHCNGAVAPSLAAGVQIKRPRAPRVAAAASGKQPESASPPLAPR
jgi:hypothetical protein